MMAFLFSPLGKIAGVALLLVAAYLGFRVWLHQHDADVLSGYVLLSEKVTAEAKATEMERQRNVASQSLDEQRKREAADAIVEQQKDADRENEILSYEIRLSEANRKCLVDSADRDWLRKH